MGGVLFFMLVAYLGVGTFIMRRHYLQKHGVALTRHTPLFGAGTSLVFFWPLAMAFGGDRA